MVSLTSSFVGRRTQHDVPRLKCGSNARLQSARRVRATGADREGFEEVRLTRREGLLALGVAAAPVLWQTSASAAPRIPPGYKRHVDRLDGYTFVLPDGWVQLTTSGNDCFYRNPANVEENVFVDVSSPSSSKYATVEDLGSPDDAADRTLNQYLEEFMSTRLGVKRSGEIVSARSRTADDDKVYYDIVVRLKSYASRNQLAVTPQERQSAVELEWDRILLTTLGVANRRLYSIRIQTPAATFDANQAELTAIAQSFVCKEVDV